MVVLKFYPTMNASPGRNLGLLSPIVTMRLECMNSALKPRKVQCLSQSKFLNFMNKSLMSKDGESFLEW